MSRRPSIPSCSLWAIVAAVVGIALAASDSSTPTPAPMCVGDASSCRATAQEDSLGTLRPPDDSEEKDLYGPRNTLLPTTLRPDWDMSKKLVVDWQCEDVLRWLEVATGTSARTEACRDKGGRALSGTAFIQDTVHDDVRTSIGFVGDELEHKFRVAASMLRRSISLAPRSFFEWRAANKRLCDFWIVPLSAFSPRILRFYARWNTITSDGAIDNYDDWADNTTLTRFVTTTIVSPHLDLFQLSRRLTIPGVADWIIWSVMLLQILDDIAIFCFMVAHLGYRHRLGSVRRVLEMEVFGLLLASLLWALFDPTWYSDICLYGAIFVLYPGTLLYRCVCQVLEMVEFRSNDPSAPNLIAVPDLMASSVLRHISASMVDSMFSTLFILSIILTVLFVSDSDGSDSVTVLDILLPLGDDDASGHLSDSEMTDLQTKGPLLLVGFFAALALFSFACKFALAVGRQQENAKLLQADLRAKDIDFDEHHDFLAEGSFAKVYRVQWHGATVAAKVLKVRRHDKHFHGVVTTLRHEAEQQALLRHPHIVTFFGVCLNDEKPIMLLEFLSGGALSTRLHTYPDLEPPDNVLNWAERIEVARDVASGLTYLHTKAVAHLDLKPDNVLLSDQGHAKVGDFGLATRLHHRMGLPLFGFKGTMLYMSPEQHCNHRARTTWAVAPRPISTKSDVYSFGILLNELEFGYTPWFDVKHVFMTGRTFDVNKLHDAIVHKNMRPTVIDTPNPYIQDIVTACWRPNAEDRLTMNEVLHTLRQLTPEMLGLVDVQDLD